MSGSLKAYLHEEIIKYLQGVIKRPHEGFMYFLIIIIVIFIFVKEMLLYTGKYPLGAPLVQ